MSTGLYIHCLDCHQLIQLTEQPASGTIIVCATCGTELEIINLDPPELDWVYLQPMQVDNRRLVTAERKGDAKKTAT
jgi:lysine biosynthesis protein LysW